MNKNQFSYSLTANCKSDSSLGWCSLEGVIYDVCHLSYPLAVNVYLLVMLFYGIQIRGAEKAETDT